MASVQAPQHQVSSEGETLVVSVSYANRLDDGELLTGTPTVAEQTTSDLTIGNVAVSTAELTINDETVPTGEAVQFSVSGMQAGTNYTIKITVSTDATPAQTFVNQIRLNTEP